jgi:hypothetical protein
MKYKNRPADMAPEPFLHCAWPFAKPEENGYSAYYQIFALFLN